MLKEEDILKEENEEDILKEEDEEDILKEEDEEDILKEEEEEKKKEEVLKKVEKDLLKEEDEEDEEEEEGKGGFRFREFKTTAECLLQYDGIFFAEYAKDCFNVSKKASTSSAKSLLLDLTSWKKDLIKAPLLNHTDANVKKECLQMFKNITGAMSDRKSSKKFDEHALKILATVLSFKSESLQNEIYCQLVKQTTSNPSQPSNQLGWRLILICLHVFPPSRDLVSYLMAYFCENVKKGSAEVSKLAEKALQSLQQVERGGMRSSVPTLSDLPHMYEI